MRKISIVLFVAFITFFAHSQQVFAQEDVQDVRPEATEEVVEEESFSSELIVTIYVDENCPHCKIVEDFVSKYKLEEYVVYKQLNGNDALYNELAALWEEFDVDDREQGWPFMVYEKDGARAYKVGDEPITDFMVEEYQVELDEVDSQKNGSSGTNSGLLLVGGVFFFSIIGFVVYSKVFDTQE